MKLSVILIVVLLKGIKISEAAKENRQNTTISTKKSDSSSSVCEKKLTCNACIQTPHCGWCTHSKFKNKPRCFDSSDVSECSADSMVNPLNKEIATKNSKTDDKNIIQMSPQEVSLTLRVNEKHKLSVNFEQAKNHPLDLYYLMDLSQSMSLSKDKLSTLGDLLASTMLQITSDFRIGFGSFIDKVSMPYVSMVSEKTKPLCDACGKPFGYRNDMPLTNNTHLFSEKVNAANVSSNLDKPEGGFDALMQAVVCKKEIGWRNGSRKLIVFSTDDIYHLAGDGKLGGVMKPNDGLCHMTDNMYTHSNILDYPSIPHLNIKIKESAINVIFAVTVNQFENYKQLSKAINGSTCGALTKDSSNVVELVRDEYNKITSSVEMTSNAPSWIKVEFFSKCIGKKRQKTSKCEGLKVGNIVTFETVITVLSCPQNPVDGRRTVEIRPVGVDEVLKVDIETLCSCDCETNAFLIEEKSAECSENGTLRCGLCECSDDFYGENCECSGADAKGTSSDCQKTNDTDIDCNGRGQCICGKCVCDTLENPKEVISGEFCECDNFSCERHDSLICSGPENGVCECGQCKCFDSWEGEACECSSLTDDCIDPFKGEICSNHGKCRCGKCECDFSIGDFRYSGKFCEKCSTCPDRCIDLSHCVTCQINEEKSNDCEVKCKHLNMSLVETFNYHEGDDEHVCEFFDAQDCRYKFAYNDKNDNDKILHVQMLEHRDCPPKTATDPFTIIYQVILPIVLVGLATLLLWKLLTTFQDRKEFARFEKEKLKAKWETGENPLYQSSVSTYKNPTYKGNAYEKSESPRKAE